MTSSTKLGTPINWIVGILFTIIGLINVFSGNDLEFGLFIILISLVYYPPVDRFIKQKIDPSISKWYKMILGLFILWASLGVGELIDKAHHLFLPFF